MGFAMAFRVTSGKKGRWKNLHDPDFVEFALVITEKETSTDGVVSYREIPLNFHWCTSEDEK